MRASFLAPLLAVLLDILGAGSLAHAAPVTVRDDLGHTLTLPAPAQRVVSLALAAASFAIGYIGSTIWQRVFVRELGA